MKGFTVLELLFACAILLVLIFAVFQVMTTGSSSWTTGDVSVELRQQIIKAFTVMEKELMGTAPAQISLGSGSSSNSLNFKLPQRDSNNHVVLGSNGAVTWESSANSITYTLAGSQITRAVSGTTKILANNVTSLQFSRPATPLNLLQINIAVRKTTTAGRQMQDSGEIQIKMRNR
jgi:type II secretory pathway component PulJ